MGWQLSTYRALSYAIAWLAPPLLRRRLARGKEDPVRWREKLGQPSAPRPAGRLVWINAVGLGEVLALRGLIAAMAAQNADVQFLITSTTRGSMQVLHSNMPPRSIHQFLPLDAPQYVAAFLRHWRPDLSIWAEQEIWPNAALMAARGGVPLALVNARISAASFARRRRGRGLFSDVLGHFALLAAQDTLTADYLRQLGAGNVLVLPSLKAAAPPLAVDMAQLAARQRDVQGRRLWLLASSWPEDEAIALRIHAQLVLHDPSALLIIAPRQIARAGALAQMAVQQGLRCAQRSAAPQIAADTQVYIADTLGEMGLWYRLCRVALIGGSFGATQGHNPWEAAILGCAILHGPNTENFRADYAQLGRAQAALCVDEGGLLAAVLADHTHQIARAQHLSDAAQNAAAPLAAQLIGLIR